ncbi:MAG TPA: DUF1646 family protein [Sporosarcina sp.]|nr:DUF1646 family protein [Sporosarcina sp.]
MLFLSILLCTILLLPILNSFIERQLEFFLFCCSILAIIGTNQFSIPLLRHAIVAPISITIAVFIASLLFLYYESPFRKLIIFGYQRTPKRLFLALIPLLLGLLSSLITAIIATLLLITITRAVGLQGKDQVRFVIMNCFAIGVGAALTPIGEPLSTIVTNQLQASPTFLFQLLAPIILPLLGAFSIVTFFIVTPRPFSRNMVQTRSYDTMHTIIVRTVKIYLFVFALTLLGISFQPLIEQYIIPLNLESIYWMNMLSAILDNATLAAAEMSPQLSEEAIRTILIGLLISGGMLIPGNIPNIIAAKQLNITSAQWARFGIPIGLLFMLIYYLFVLHFN